MYENIHTEERQSWFPDTPAAEEGASKMNVSNLTSAAPPLVAQSESDKKKEELKARNLAALAKRKESMQEQKAAEATLELPSGWIRTESRSRPGYHSSYVIYASGEVVYENTATGERQAWFPTEAVSAEDKKKAVWFPSFQI